MSAPVIPSVMNVNNMDNQNSNYILYPVKKFIERYTANHPTRLHMPGHKGRFGYDADITEIKGADSLYEADGIIAESEKRTAELFGTRNTFFSTEGSSQVIKAMCYLSINYANNISSNSERLVGQSRPVIFATRNAHKSFIYASMLLGFQIVWLIDQDEEDYNLCRCSVTAEGISRRIREYKEEHPDAILAAVYVTSPDYLGNIMDIRSIADEAHRAGLLLLVDNAHGAYLKLLSTDLHPITLGADMASDSAHKTFPVLTGGAYLHISDSAPEGLEEDARRALLMFGSTSPSYMIIRSLDEAIGRISKEDYRIAAKRLDVLKIDLSRLGIGVYGERNSFYEPLKLVIVAESVGMTGNELAERLRENSIECEYADPELVVTMWSPYNNYPADTDNFLRAMKEIVAEYKEKRQGKDIKAVKTGTESSGVKDVPGINGLTLKNKLPEIVYQPYEVLYMKHHSEPVNKELIGKIAADISISCPPAVAPIVAGERFDENVINILKHYGIDKVEVVN